jgi:hypothetical protein
MPGDDVLALGVDQIFAVVGALAGRRVAGEGDAGGGGFAHIAEHHRLDVDGGAPVARDVVEAAIDLGAIRLPGAEHGADRAPELFLDVLREGPTEFLFGELLEAFDQALEIGGVEIGVEVDALVLLGDLQRVFEQAVIKAEDDVGIHLDEAAIAVPGEAGVAAHCGEALDRAVVEAEVEDGVHHAGHGDAGAGADRDQERIGGVAEAFAGDLFDVGDAGGGFGAQGVGEAFALGIIERADRGGDGEARRDGQADGGHFGEVGALAAEQILIAVAAVGNAAAEAVNVLGHAAAPPRGRGVKFMMFTVSTGGREGAPGGAGGEKIAAAKGCGRAGAGFFRGRMS